VISIFAYLLDALQSCSFLIQDNVMLLISKMIKASVFALMWLTVGFRPCRVTLGLKFTVCV